MLLEPVISSRFSGSDGVESDASLLYPWAENGGYAKEFKISFRNFAAAVSLSCFIAAILLGESLTGSLAARPSFGSIFGWRFKPSEMLFVHQSWTAIMAIVLGVWCGMLLLAMVCIRQHQIRS